MTVYVTYGEDVFRFTSGKYRMYLANLARNRAPKIEEYAVRVGHIVSDFTTLTPTGAMELLLTTFDTDDFERQE